MEMRRVILFFLDFFMESLCGGGGEFYSTRERWVFFSPFLFCFVQVLVENQGDRMGA